METKKTSISRYIGFDVLLLPKEAISIIEKSESDFVSIEKALIDVENSCAELFTLSIDDQIKCVFIGHYNITPLKRDYCITALAGNDMHEWIDDLIEFLTAKSQIEELDHVYVMGRRGWGKIYNQFQEKAVIYECPVPKGGGLHSVH